MADPIAPESGISDGTQPYKGWPTELHATSEGQPYKKKKRKRRVTVSEQPLSINSLMDIVTIILVYLLKSYATSPIEVKDPAIELPTSTSQETVEEAAVVMITGPITRGLNAQNQTVLLENEPTLVVDGKPLFGLTKIAGADGQPSFRIPDAQKDKPGGFVVKQLITELAEAKKTQELAAEINEREFTGKVVILADKRTPYRVLMDILVTCGQAGFGEFKFAIVKQEKKG